MTSSKRPLATALKLASRRRSSAAGISLTELLLYMTLGAVLVATTATTVITNVRTASNLELRQRGVDDFGRLNLFLQSEVSEGEWIEYDNINLPEADCGEGQPLFAIVLPNPLNPAEPPAERLQEPMPRIYYFTRNGGADLWRCGPSFDENGSLIIQSDGNLAAIAASRVNADTRISLVNTDDDRLLQYTLELRSRAGTTTLQRGSTDAPLVARTGVRAIE